MSRPDLCPLFHEGPSWGPLGPPSGGHGGLLGKFGASEARKGENPKNIEKTMKINDFGIFGPSSVASWRPLGASWKLLGLFGRSLGRLGASVRRFGALLDPPRDPRSHQGAPRGAPQNLRGAPKSPQELPGSPREPPGAPRSRWESGVPAPQKASAPLDLRTAGLHELWGTPLRAEGTVADLQNNARFLKNATNIELMHDGTTANERTHFQLLAHFANVRYQTHRHMKTAVRSFVVQQMMAWYLSTNVKLPYTSSSDQRSGTVLKRFISSVEKQFNNVEEKETAVRKRAASRSRAALETIAAKKRRA